MKKQFRNRLGFLSGGRGKMHIYVTVANDHKKEYFHTPRRSREYWGELNQSPFGQLTNGFRTQYLLDMKLGSLGLTHSRYLRKLKRKVCR